MLAAISEDSQQRDHPSVERDPANDQDAPGAAIEIEAESDGVDAP
jgi:hypothetical protein